MASVPQNIAGGRTRRTDTVRALDTVQIPQVPERVRKTVEGGQSWVRKNMLMATAIGATAIGAIASAGGYLSMKIGGEKTDENTAAATTPAGPEELQNRFSQEITNVTNNSQDDPVFTSAPAAPEAAAEPVSSGPRVINVAEEFPELARLTDGFNVTVVQMMKDLEGDDEGEVEIVVAVVKGSNGQVRERIFDTMNGRETAEVLEKLLIEMQVRDAIDAIRSELPNFDSKLDALATVAVFSDKIGEITGSSDIRAEVFQKGVLLVGEHFR